MRGKLASIKMQRTRYVAMDFITTNIAFLIFDILRYALMTDFTEFGHLGVYLGSPTLIVEQLAIPVVMLGVYWLSGYYNHPFERSRILEFVTTLETAVVGTLLIYFALLINDQLSTRIIQLEVLGTLFLSLFLCVYSGRLYITASTTKLLKNRVWCFNTIVMGTSGEAMKVTDRLLKANTNLGYNIVGYLPIQGETPAEGTYPCINGKQFETYIKSGTIDQIIIVPDPTHREEKILEILYSMFPLQIPIKIAPSSLSFLTAGIRAGDIHAEPFVDITSPTMSPGQSNLKRMSDVLTSAFVLTLLSPLMLAVALAIRFTSKGPAIYSQERIGYRQKPFRIYKFRSMRVDAESSGPRTSEENDSRITSIGRLLRKYRIDEIPQFWNVLKGDMSLVGPRPEREFFIRQIVQQAPYYTLVHQVRPGITSWGMVKFGYAKTVEEMVERTRYDLIYLSNMSIPVDFKILLHTIRTVIKGEGV